MEQLLAKRLMLLCALAMLCPAPVNSFASTAAVGWDVSSAKLIAAVEPVIATRDGQLQMSTNIKTAMQGKCTRWADFTPAKRTWMEQCQESEADATFPLGPPPASQTAYYPSAILRKALADFSGLPQAAIDGLEILSNLSSAPASVQGLARGKWCSMPSPGSDGPDNAYWQKCVQPNTGFFNLLTCEQDGGFAQIGIAAMDAGLCYPMHDFHHLDASEVSWQIGGKGVSRSWNRACMERSSSKEHAWDAPPPGCWFSGDIPGIAGGPLSRVENAPGNLHEFDTTASGEDYMLLVYFWGQATLSTAWLHDNSAWSDFGEATDHAHELEHFERADFWAGYRKQLRSSCITEERIPNPDSYRKGQPVHC